MVLMAFQSFDGNNLCTPTKHASSCSTSWPSCRLSRGLQDRSTSLRVNQSLRTSPWWYPKPSDLMPQHQSFLFADPRVPVLTDGWQYAYTRFMLNKTAMHIHGDGNQHKSKLHTRDLNPVCPVFEDCRHLWTTGPANLHVLASKCTCTKGARYTKPSMWAPALRTTLSKASAPWLATTRQKAKSRNQGNARRWLICHQQQKQA